MIQKCIPLLFFALAWAASTTAGTQDWFDFHNAARHGDMIVINYLASTKNFSVDTRDPDDWTPLHVAAWYNQVETVELLLDYGADVNARTKFDWTPLHCAALQGSIDCVRILLDNGAEVLAQTKRNDTPITFALKKNHTSVVTYLKALSIYSIFKPKDANQH